MVRPASIGVAWAFAVAVSLAQEPPPPAYAGTWKGTVGAAAVMVCLSRFGEATYYDTTQRQGIPLRAPRGAGGAEDHAVAAMRSGHLEFDERVHEPGHDRRVSGRWSLRPAADGSLVGEWRDPGAARSAEIRLVRVPEPHVPARLAPGSDCPATFYAPLLSALRPTRSESAFQGRAHGHLATPDAEAFAPPASMPHAARLERLARRWLEEQAVFAFDCAMGSGVSRPLGRSLLPVEWNARFLVLQDSLPDTYCGGAHGSFATSYITWSIEAGRTVDTWRWLAGGRAALESRGRGAEVAPPSALDALLAKLHPGNLKDDPCSEVVQHMSLGTPRGSAGGLVFPTDFAHALRACGEDIVVPWATVAPFLSAEGRAAARAWAGSGAGRPAR
jgi:hypothetical protein